MELFQPLCLVSEADEGLRASLALYEQAVADYRARNWEAARSALCTLQEQKEDALHALYLERMQGNVEELPEDWAAVYTHSAK